MTSGTDFDGGRIFVDGRFRKAGEVEPVIEAATGEPLGDGSSATEAEI
ncbi:MAG: aldehyde dehydrogenase, partial [Mycobacterium sp.]|nr:aldehyde dehydrogenase [Mycobacterium sp.]